LEIPKGNFGYLGRKKATLRRKKGFPEKGFFYPWFPVGLKGFLKPLV